MFHWICPECGREIAPAVKECPACDPAAVAVESIPEPELVGVAARTPEVVFAPRVERSRPVREGAPVLTIDAEPIVEIETVEEIEAVAESGAVVEIDGAVEPEVVAEPEAFEEPVPVVEIEAAVESAPEPPDPAIAPRRPLPQGDAIAPSAPQLRPEHPLYPGGSEPVLATAPIADPVERTLPVADGRVRDDRELAPAVPAPMPHPLAGPELAEPPAAVRPQLASHGPQPPLGDLTVDTAGAMARVRAATPRGRPSGGVNEHLTIPGPALPIELTSLEGAGISKVLKPRAAKAVAKAGMPGWLLSGLVAATVVATCISAALYLIPAGAAPVPTVKAVEKAPAKPVSPLAKFIEVTGFRHVAMSDKSEIRYLVVNHSAALLSDVTVFVTLRGASPEPGAPPLSNFSFKMPKLGPWESKEMVSPVEKVTRPGAMPEWRELTAEVEIGQ